MKVRIGQIWLCNGYKNSEGNLKSGNWAGSKWKITKLFKQKGSKHKSQRVDDNKKITCDGFKRGDTGHDKIERFEDGTYTLISDPRYCVLCNLITVRHHTDADWATDSLCWSCV